MHACRRFLAATAATMLTAPALALDYRAPLQPVNPALTAAGLTGDVRLEHDGDQLHIDLRIKGLAPGALHMQHLHGSADPTFDAECAPMGLEADGDQLTDLVDTRPYSGKTLIPLHDDPTSLQLKSDTYPVSNRAGGYHYRKTVDWDELQAAVAREYGIEEIELGRMVVYIHGVAEELPGSVDSLPGVPAQQTIPVACGELDMQPADY